MDIARRPTDSHLSPPPHAAAGEPEFLVACLCADWCGTCRDYQHGFQDLAAQFPQARFVWLDIENDAALLEDLDDLDVENFPTLLIQRRTNRTAPGKQITHPVLFFGVMLPHLQHLQRTLETFIAQPPDEAHDYATRNPERLGWQNTRNLWPLLASA